MTKEYPGTFNEWIKESNSEVRLCPPSEVKGYQSEYMRMFTYLREKGWYKEGNRWVSPHNSNIKHKTIKDAYGSQKLKEIQDER